MAMNSERAAARLMELLAEEEDDDDGSDVDVDSVSSLPVPYNIMIDLMINELFVR